MRMTGAATPPGDEHALVAAALAVNEAATLDEALAALAEAGRSVLGSDRASVLVWDERLERAVCRAVAGVGAEMIGEVFTAGSSAPFEAATTRRAVIGPGDLSDYSPGMRETIAGFARTIIVPLFVQGQPPMTFQAAWREDPGPEAVQRAIGFLQTLGSLTGIAYRAERERSSRIDRARLRAVIDSVGEGIWLHTRETHWANAAARRILAIPDDLDVKPEDIAVRALDGRIVPPEEHPSAIAHRTGKPVSFRARNMRFDGVERILEGAAAPVYTEEGEDVGTVFSFRDITEQYETEFLNRELLRAGFEALPVPVAVIEPGTLRLLSINAAFCTMVGYAAAEARDILPPYPWWTTSVEEFAKLESVPPEGTARFETLFRHRDGRLIPVDITRVVVKNSSGEPAAVLGVCVDLTERRRFEQQLVQSGKLAALGELAAGVAHEINNPLFAVLGLVEFLLKDAEPGTKAHDRLALVHKTGLEIKEIVRALLDFAREPSDVFNTLLVHEVAAQTVELVRRTSAAKGVELVERYSTEPAAVHGSPNQLKQVLLNLITNAQQAMPDGGVTTVGLEHEPGFAVLTVADTGPGIPEDVLPRVFEPFYTTRRGLGGTGLGLAVSLGIAQIHGGDLSAANRPEGGAVFTLRLPLLPEGRE